MNDLFYSKLKSSLFSERAENWYIWLAFKIELVVLIGIVFVYFLIRNARKKHRKIEGALYMIERILNEFFVTGISIFPLLGLFGTVKALLSIDFSTEMANTQAHFFDALTSTACGIIFAVFFKIVNAVVAPCMDRLFINEEQRLHRVVASPRKKAEK